MATFPEGSQLDYDPNARPPINEASISHVKWGRTLSDTPGFGKLLHSLNEHSYTVANGVDLDPITPGSDLVARIEEFAHKLRTSEDDKQEYSINVLTNGFIIYVKTNDGPVAVLKMTQIDEQKTKPELKQHRDLDVLLHWLDAGFATLHVTQFFDGDSYKDIKSVLDSGLEIRTSQGLLDQVASMVDRMQLPKYQRYDITFNQSGKSVNIIYPIGSNTILFTAEIVKIPAKVDTIPVQVPDSLPGLPPEETPVPEVIADNTEEFLAELKGGQSFEALMGGQSIVVNSADSYEAVKQNFAQILGIGESMIVVKDIDPFSGHRVYRLRPAYLDENNIDGSVSDFRRADDQELVLFPDVVESTESGVTLLGREASTFVEFMSLEPKLLESILQRTERNMKYVYSALAAFPPGHIIRIVYDKKNHSVLINDDKYENITIDGCTKTLSNLQEVNEPGEPWVKQFVMLLNHFDRIQTYLTPDVIDQLRSDYEHTHVLDNKLDFSMPDDREVNVNDYADEKNVSGLGAYMEAYFAARFINGSNAVHRKALAEGTKLNPVEVYESTFNRLLSVLETSLVSDKAAQEDLKSLFASAKEASLVLQSFDMEKGSSQINHRSLEGLVKRCMDALHTAYAQEMDALLERNAVDTVMHPEQQALEDVCAPITRNIKSKEVMVHAEKQGNRFQRLIGFVPRGESTKVLVPEVEVDANLVYQEALALLGLEGNIQKDMIPQLENTIRTFEALAARLDTKRMSNVVTEQLYYVQSLLPLDIPEESYAFSTPDAFTKDSSLQQFVSELLELCQKHRTFVANTEKLSQEEIQSGAEPESELQILSRLIQSSIQESGNNVSNDILVAIQDMDVETIENYCEYLFDDGTMNVTIDGVEAAFPPIDHKVNPSVSKLAGLIKTEQDLLMQVNRSIPPLKNTLQSQLNQTRESIELYLAAIQAAVRSQDNQARAAATKLRARLRQSLIDAGVSSQDMKKLALHDRDILEVLIRTSRVCLSQLQKVNELNDKVQNEIGPVLRLGYYANENSVVREKKDIQMENLIAQYATSQFAA